MGNDARILFLHHSTGECIWNAEVKEWFNNYNSSKWQKFIKLTNFPFPKAKPYG